MRKAISTILGAALLAVGMAATAGEARLTWEYATDDMGSFVVYCEGGQNSVTTVTSQGGTNREEIVTLESGVLWECRLTAVNEFGVESDYSAPAPVDFSKPVPPTGLGATRVPVTININFN